MKDFWASTPTLPAAVGLSSGIIAHYCGMPLWSTAVIIAAALILSLLRFYRIAFTALFLSLGWFLSSSQKPLSVEHQYLEKHSEMAGEVVKVNRTANGETTVDVSTGPSTGGFICRLRLLGYDKSLSTGDSIFFKTRLRHIEADDDGYDLYENRYGSASFLADKVIATGYVASEDCRVTGRNSDKNSVLKQWRDRIYDSIMSSGVNNSTAWLMQAVLLGDDSGLHPATVEQMRSVGVAHYLALSGFHVGIIALIASTLLIAFKTWSHIGRKRHILVIALIWIFAALCGMSPSLLRASIFITIALTAKILQRQSTPLNSLCVAAVISLVINPYWLFTPGFQLSFAAVAAIVTLSEPLNPFGRCKNFYLKKAGLFISVPLSATIGTTLIAACHFHRVPLLFLPADILIAILMPMFITLAAIVVGLTTLGIHFSFGIKVLEWLNNCMNDTCATLSSLPCAEIRGVNLQATTVMILATAIIIFIVSVNRKSRPWIFASLFIACIGIGSISLSARPASVALKMGGNGRRCELLAATDTHCIAITDENKIVSATTVNELNRRYSQYLDRRYSGDVSVTMPDGDFDLTGIKRVGNYIIIGNNVIYTLFDSNPANVISGLEIDYLYVSRAGSKSFKDVVTRLAPKTVVIAANTTRHRAASIIDICRRQNIPFIRLDSSGLIIPIR